MLVDRRVRFLIWSPTTSNPLMGLNHLLVMHCGRIHRRTVHTGVAECVLAAACVASAACTVALPIETKNRGLTVRELWSSV